MGLQTNLLPHEEMQLAHLWHAIVATTMIIAIVAHIYIGSVGMEGAFDAMGNGQVDLEWARQHHDLWVEEEEAKGVPIQKLETYDEDDVSSVCFYSSCICRRLFRAE